MSLPVTICGASIKGRRAENQDRIFFSSRENSPVRAIVAVADGMGGTRGGEIASQEVIKDLENIFHEVAPENPEDLKEWLREYLNKATARLKTLAAEDPYLRDMGSTFVASVLLNSGKLVTVNIGDSRSYMVTSRQISRITVDHTVEEQARQEGSKVLGGMERMKDYLTRALTPYSGDVPDFFCHTLLEPLQEGVVVATCSDGLYKFVPDSIIHETVLSSDNLEDALAALISYAKESGSNDNISVAAMEIGKLERKFEMGFKTAPVERRKKPARAFRNALLLVFGLLLAAAVTFFLVKG